MVRSIAAHWGVFSNWHSPSLRAQPVRGHASLKTLPRLEIVLHRTKNTWLNCTSSYQPDAGPKGKLQARPAALFAIHCAPGSIMPRKTNPLFGRQQKNPPRADGHAADWNEATKTVLGGGWRGRIVRRRRVIGGRRRVVSRGGRR